VTQNITVSVGTDDTGNSFFQRTGDPLSQSQGSNQISIVPITVSLTPSTLNLSTGDTNKYITTSVFPSNIPFTVVYSTGLASPQPAGSECSPALSAPSGSGTNFVNTIVQASPSNCSGVFNVIANAYNKSSQQG